MLAKMFLMRRLQLHIQPEYRLLSMVYGENEKQLATVRK